METVVTAAERMTIEEFAEKHGLVMEIKERNRWSCPEDDARWSASFRGVEVRTGTCCLLSEFGNGPTPTAAIEDYARRITGKLLIVDAYKESRREIYAHCDFVAARQGEGRDANAR